MDELSGLSATCWLGVRLKLKQEDSVHFKNISQTPYPLLDSVFEGDVIYWWSSDQIHLVEFVLKKETLLLLMTV